jgi:O-antigen/teichoic acid export membrane protein
MKKDILVYFIGKTIPALVSLAIIVLGVRLLGNEQYGVYSLVFSGSVLVANLSYTWIQQSMIRFLSAFKSNPGPSVARYFFLTLCSGLAGALVMFAVCLLYFRLNLPQMLVVVFYTLMYGFFIFRLTVYQSLMKPLKYAAYEGLYNLIMLGVFLGLLYLLSFRTFLAPFVAMGAALLAAAIIHTLFMREKEHDFDLRKIHWDPAFTKNALNYGFALTLWILIYTVTSVADRYVIKEFQDYSAVGTYSAVKDLAVKISTFAILPFFLAFNAKINDAWNSGNESKALKLVRQALLLESIVCILVVAGFVLFRNLLLTRLLHLQGSGLILSSVFLIAGAFFWQAALVIHKPLELLMKQYTMVMVLVGCLVVNILANVVFVPRYGYNASAIIFFLSALQYSCLALALSSRYLKKHHAHREAEMTAEQESMLIQ